MKIGFIGTGNMGGALASAAAKSGKVDILLANRTAEKAQALANAIGTAFGAGFYAGGLICYAFIFLAMQVLRRVDLRIRKTQRVSTVYFEMESKSTAGRIIRHVKSRGHYIWDLDLFSDAQAGSGGPVCGTFTLWVNGRTTLDEELQELEKLDGVSYMTLM